MGLSLAKFQSHRSWEDAHHSLGAAKAPPIKMGSTYKCWQSPPFQNVVVVFLNPFCHGGGGANWPTLFLSSYHGQTARPKWNCHYLSPLEFSFVLIFQRNVGKSSKNPTPWNIIPHNSLLVLCPWKGSTKVSHDLSACWTIGTAPTQLQPQYRAEKVLRCSGSGNQWCSCSWVFYQKQYLFLQLENDTISVFLGNGVLQNNTTEN